MAGLLDAGMLDENGVLNSGQENRSAFMLVPPNEAGNEKGVYLTQKDVGEVQLAKAAIAAGIQMLMERLEITEKEIQTVYIAGAFGNYMNPVSAGKIGLLPASLVKKVKPVGNAAGEGAKIALVNEKEMLDMDELVRKIEFVELAASIHRNFRIVLLMNWGFLRERRNRNVRYKEVRTDGNGAGIFTCGVIGL